MDNQKVLVLDIETGPMIAYVWGLWDQNIALNQIKQDWALFAWGAKWYDRPSKEFMYMDQRNKKDPYNDKEILLSLWKLLNQADKVITQNGQSFDGPKLNARFILQGMNPPSPYKHIDTYRICKRVAKFTSNKLEYLSKNINSEYKKSSHGKFVGMRLWSECINGNSLAWDEMKKYNRIDVLSTEELYKNIRAWTPQTMTNIFVEKDKCRTCGESSYLWHKGYERKKSGMYHRYQCQKCFTWTVGEKV